MPSDNEEKKSTEYSPKSRERMRVSIHGKNELEFLEEQVQVLTRQLGELAADIESTANKKTTAEAGRDTAKAAKKAPTEIAEWETKMSLAVSALKILNERHAQFTEWKDDLSRQIEKLRANRQEIKEPIGRMSLPAFIKMAAQAGNTEKDLLKWEIKYLRDAVAQIEVALQANKDYISERKSESEDTKLHAPDLSPADLKILSKDTAQLIAMRDKYQAQIQTKEEAYARLMSPSSVSSGVPAPPPHPSASPAPTRTTPASEAPASSVSPADPRPDGSSITHRKA